MDAQRTLIELCFHCLLLAGKVKLQDRHLYYDIIVLVLERGELGLESIGVFQDEDNTQYREQKVKIASFFNKLLLTALDDAIQKFQRKGVEMYLRNYIETTIVTCYLKVPDFREAFLDCVKKSKHDREVQELSLIGITNVKRQHSDSSYAPDESQLH